MLKDGTSARRRALDCSVSVGEWIRVSNACKEADCRWVEGSVAEIDMVKNRAPVSLRGRLVAPFVWRDRHGDDLTWISALISCDSLGMSSVLVTDIIDGRISDPRFATTSFRPAETPISGTGTFEMGMPNCNTLDGNRIGLLSRL
jgi:hypothetical protein